MTAGIIDAVDPNTQHSSKELAVVARSAATLRTTGLSITELGAKADQLTRQSLDLVSQCQRVPAVIENDEVYASAGALLGVSKKVLHQAEADRKIITKPILDLKDAVDAVFGAARAGAFSVKESLTLKIAHYLQRKRAADAVAAEARKAAIVAEVARLAEASSGARLEAIRQAAAELDELGKVESPPVEAHGIKTSAATMKSVVVEDVIKAAAFVLANARPDEASAIITMNKAALKEFVKRVQGGELRVSVGEMGGLSVTESDIIRNF